jgi:hypothetical protein
MLKHKLCLDDISVESFSTDTNMDKAGTVKAHEVTDEIECGAATTFVHLCGGGASCFESCVVTHCAPQVTCTDFTHEYNKSCPPQATCVSPCHATAEC